MASSPGPSTPDEAPRRMPTMNRSFTLPIKPSTPTKAVIPPPEIGSTEGIETLYVHPSASIIKFTATARRGQSGTLSWTQPTERTMAAGQLEIYRVPGSVSFLHSGTVLHTIMKRSQCWCVDDISKFVLRVLMDTYYRIELPGETEEDLEMVERFKVTLQKVCHYERTPCPFRDETIEVPEEPEVRKGKRRKSTGPAKKWKLDRVWRPEGWVEPEKASEDSASGSGSPAGSDEESDSAPAPMETEETVEEVRPITPSTPMRVRALAALRSASAPQSPVPLSTPPSRLRTKVDVDGTVEVSEPVASESSPRERPALRTFQAIPTDMPPSPPDSSAGVEVVDDRERHESEPVDAQLAHSSDAPLSAYTEKQAESESVRVGKQTQINEQPQQHIKLPASAADEEGSTLEHLPTHAFSIEDDDGDAITPNEAVNDGAIASLPNNTAEIPDDVVHEQDIASDSLSQQTALHVPQESISRPIESSDLSRPNEDDPRTEMPHALQDAVEDQDREEGLKEADDESRPTTPEGQTAVEDPYAAIQARILARRSIGGTTSFYPGYKSPTRQSTSSTSSTATISSTKSAVSRRSQSSRRQQAFASAMVKKAYDVFLGPPAHLVAIMLQIAARFANGAFGVDSMFYVESPIDSPRKVPGSYYLQGDYVEELDSDWEEDDFGVPLRSPVRLASRSEGSDGVRERRGWDVD